MRDLNFVLRSKIFVNTDGQLRASHLILGCNPVYLSWQPFWQALLVDSPLLSYIDVWHPNFLLPNLILGEAQDFGPRIVKAKSLVPMRDNSADLAFQNRTVHRPIGEPEAPIQPSGQVAAEFVNSYETKANQGK